MGQTMECEANILEPQDIETMETILLFQTINITNSSIQEVTTLKDIHNPTIQVEIHTEIIPLLEMPTPL